MSINQDVRYSGDLGPKSNPTNIYEEVKPSRIIITTGEPTADDGGKTWYAIDNTNSDLYYRHYDTDEWEKIYTFTGGGGGGGITGARNIGLGQPVFKSNNLGVLEFRTLIGVTRGDQVGVEIARNNFAPLDNEVELSVPRGINNVVDGTAGGYSLINFINFDNITNAGTLGMRTLIAGPGIEIGIDGQNRVLIESTGVAGTLDFFSSYLTIPFPALNIPPNSANQIITITDALSVIIGDPESEWELLQSGLPPLGGNMIFRYSGLNGHSYRASMDVTVNTGQQSGSGVPIIIQFFIRIRDSGGVLVYDLPSSTASVMFPGTDSNVTTYASGSSTFIIQPIQNYTYTIQAVFRSTSPVFVRSYQIEKLNMTLSKVG
jgi:hypothetical protein